MFFEKNKDSLAFRVRKNCNDVDMGNGEVYLSSNVLDEWLPIKSKAEKSLEKTKKRRWTGKRPKRRKKPSRKLTWFI